MTDPQLLDLAVQMRKAQVDYHRHGGTAVQLATAKYWESRFDQAVRDRKAPGRRSPASRRRTDRMDILPCPLCGKPGKHYPPDDDEYHYIVCENSDVCGYESSWGKTKADAVRSWNEDIERLDAEDVEPDDG